MGLLIKNIKCLVQTEEYPRHKVCGREMAKITNIHDVSLLIEGDRISDFGPMEKYPGNFRISQTASDVNDASGKMVFPSFCDPHTHLVYSGSMEQEFSGRPGLCHMRKLQRGEECISASNPGKR
ncbi:MAG: hypothetical protein GX876_12250 [Bacteroidales bacterium]|nr:hypothetical protein [Bacteroidales bacterium]